MVKSFRKIHRRWRQSLVCVLLILPIMFLSINQWRGQGICFTNPDDIRVVGRFMAALEKGDYEKASAYMNYEELYREVQTLKVTYPKTVAEQYTTVVLSEESWVVTYDFFEEYLRWEERETVIWEQIIFNHVERAMIPEKIWQEVTAAQPDSVEERVEDEFVVNGHIFVRLDTKWGTYMAARNSGLEECVTAEDFCNVLELIPEEIYKEAYPEGYKESYYNAEKEGWHITYGLIVHNHTEKTPITVCFLVQAGRLKLVSIGYEELFAGKELVSDALSVSYFE